MTVKVMFRFLLAGGMVYAGAAHLRNPAPFVSIVPKWIPAHHDVVLISGVCEILGGIGLLVPAARRPAAWGLIALYIAVFPANVNMALHDLPIEGHYFPEWLLWLRLPLQAALIAWAYRYTKD
jgi:uncharacterized membrane protein